MASFLRSRLAEGVSFFLYFLFFPSQQNFLSVYAVVVVKVCFRYEFLVLGGSSSEPLHSMHLMVLLPWSV